MGFSGSCGTRTPYSPLLTSLNKSEHQLHTPGTFAAHDPATVRSAHAPEAMSHPDL